jgi:hypothetical protein
MTRDTCVCLLLLLRIVMLVSLMMGNRLNAVCKMIRHHTSSTRSRSITRTSRQELIRIIRQVFADTPGLLNLSPHHDLIVFTFYFCHISLYCHEFEKRFIFSRAHIA